MNSAFFNALANCSWECVQCGLPNFSTGMFDTTIFETSNPFSNFSNSTFASESEISFSCPNATSSPQRRHSSFTETSRKKRTDLPPRILLFNCQSIDLSTACPKRRIDGPFLLGHLLYSLVNLPMEIAITIT